MENRDWSRMDRAGLSEVTACILVGGLGTRLRSVLPNTPKALAPIEGAPFLYHLFEKLAESGIRRTVLCTGYLADQIQDQVGSSFQKMEMVYSQEARPMGTAGALRLALPYLNTPQILVLNGDSYADVDLENFLTWHHSKFSQVSMVLAKVKDVSRFGMVKANQEGEVESFVEKGAALVQGWINAGIYLLDRSLIENLPIEIELSLEKQVFPKLIGNGLYGFPMRFGDFIDIGTPDSYAQAKAFFSQRRHW